MSELGSRSNTDGRAEIVPWPGRPLIGWWAVFAFIYGACVMMMASRHDAGAIALVGFGLTVPPIALLAAIDVTTRQLPRVISYATCLLALPLLSFDPRADGDGRWSAAQGAVMMLGVTAVIRIVGRGALGRGDLHFSPLLGAVAGWFGARFILATWLATALLGGFVAMLMLLSGRGRQARFAYGPLLLLGLCVALTTGGR
jgi:leader peptidase (prepilin peptidase)/N-methyltransferase